MNAILLIALAVQLVASIGVIWNSITIIRNCQRLDRTGNPPSSRSNRVL